jgi:hypothetical protein
MWQKLGEKRKPKAQKCVKRDSKDKRQEARGEVSFRRCDAGIQTLVIKVAGCRIKSGMTNEKNSTSEGCRARFDAHRL